MMNTFKRNSDLILQCLVLYQFIEEGLRFCLARHQATTRFRLKGFLPFRISASAIEDAAMGRLTEWLRTYCDDEELLCQLSKVKSQRDKIAHRALALTLQEQKDEEHLQSALAGLAEAYALAESCFKALSVEMERADQAVKMAYAALSTECAASGQPPPEPFLDKEPDEK